MRRRTKIKPKPVLVFSAAPRTNQEQYFAAEVINILNPEAKKTYLQSLHYEKRNN